MKQANRFVRRDSSQHHPMSAQFAQQTEADLLDAERLDDPLMRCLFGASFDIMIVNYPFPRFSIMQRCAMRTGQQHDAIADR